MSGAPGQKLCPLTAISPHRGRPGALLLRRCGRNSRSRGADLYRRRKAVVEPVFGQIKQIRGFRQFSFRGLAAVQAEWQLVCLTHNLLKLFRSGACMRPA